MRFDTFRAITVSSLRFFVRTGGAPVVHIYQSRLFPGAIGAWSCHLRTTDRLFVNQGHLKIVLYDARDDSTPRVALWNCTPVMCDPRF